MAGLDNVSTPTEPTTETTDVAPQVAYKTPAGSKYNLPTIKGTSPLATASILEEMQKIIAEKEAKKQSFGEGLRDVLAYDVGYRGDLNKSLRERAAEKEQNTADIFNMRSQIAQFKSAQRQAEQQAKRLKDIASGQPMGGAAGTPSGGVTTPPPLVREEINRRLADDDNAGAQKIYDDWLKTETSETIKMETAPGAYEKKVEMEIVDELGNKKLVYVDSLTARQMRNSGTGTPTGKTVEAPPTAGTPSQPVSIRNNNPGNLVDSTGKIRTFATREEGEKALDADLQGKLSGQSPAYKTRFGELPITPARLAETWSPAKAPGNDELSTKNYGDYIAKKLGIGANDTIANTPENMAKIKQAISEFEAGVGSGAKQPTAAKPVAQPSGMVSEQTRATAAAEKAGGEEFAKKLGTETAATVSAIDKAGMTAGDDYVRASEIVKLASDPTMQEMFGVLEKGGVAPFILRQMENAINAGQFGTFGVKGLADNLAKTEATPEQIAKYDRMVRNLATAELKWAQVYLKGQGAVSDAERELIRKAVGSASGNPPKVLVMQGRIMQERAKFDNDMAKAYDAYRDKYGSYADPGKFLRGEGRALIQRHNRDLAEILGVDASEVAGMDPYKKGSIPTESTGPTSDEKKRWSERYGKKGK